MWTQVDCDELPIPGEVASTLLALSGASAWEKDILSKERWY